MSDPGDANVPDNANVPEHEVTLLHTGFVTHDVKRLVTTRPDDLDFEPGQGVEISIDWEGWEDQARPFTPTSLPEEDVLEFTIKGYPEHDGVTVRIHDLEPGASLHMSDSFGTIRYAGPGTFIAGGAGVTPFLAILRSLDPEERRKSSVIFSNDTPADVICEKELRHLFGERCHLTCTQESAPGYDDRRVDRALLDDLVDDLEQHFYVCGPPGFVEDVTGHLRDMGVDGGRIVIEE